MSLSKPDIRQNEIWLVTDSRTFGGIESHIIELAKGLRGHARHVRVILLKQYSKEPELIKRLSSNGLPCTPLDAVFPSDNMFLALVKAVRQHRPSVVHAHGYKAGILCKMIRLISRFPLAVTYHAGETPEGKVKVYDFIDRYSAFIGSLSFSVSPGIAKKIPFPTKVLNNFVAMPEPLAKRGKKIAFAGRLSYEKAPDRFVELARSFPDHSFVLYGDGDMKPGLQNDSPDNVAFAGYTEMSQVWPKVDILVIPSRFEGLPMVALEAMGRMIPVIAMDVGALNKLITSGQNGWLCQTGEQLTQALNSWLNMAGNERSQMQKNCRQTIEENYSDIKLIPEILSGYKHAGQN